MASGYSPLPCSRCEDWLREKERAKKEREWETGEGVWCVAVLNISHLIPHPYRA